MIENTKIQKIAIVGLGPKGLYGLERLLANLGRLEASFPVEIHLFNKSDSFGAGDIYRTDQPAYLLMNYANGHISMWPEEDPAPNVTRPKSFVQWLEMHQLEYPESNAYTFSSRCTVGRYLSGGFEELLQNCPESISITKHVGTVSDIKKDGEQYQVKFRGLNSGQEMIIDNFQHILIASGHPCVNDPESHLKENYIDFIYPITKRLQDIASGSKVAIKGMGLTFIDAILALTEGRKGKFELNSNNTLTYVRSGEEPEKIFPFSNSGLLMIPRGNTYGKPSYRPTYFNKQNLDNLKPKDEKFDFEKELLPLIEKEYKVVYYSKKLQQRGRTLNISEDFKKVESQIQRFHEIFPEEERFDFQSFIRPQLPHKNLQKGTLNSLQISIEEAQIGIDKSAFAATADLWRHLSDLFSELYQFGGLKPQSQKNFLLKYAGHLNRISYGPPIENMKKLLALGEADLIDFSFSQSPTISFGRKTILTNPTKESVSADYLIDARIPKIRLTECTDMLYGNLLKRELITPFVNRQIGSKGFQPGCLAIDKKGHPTDKSGQKNSSLTFTGTPTEGITYDNDSLSRKRNDFVSQWAKDLVRNLQQNEQSTNYPIPYSNA
ncbi:hypothetical protein FHS59_001412 [Algoriphagus iocasae]|uniref:FAD-dependent urate hydroxylase HpyO/Asp monooxygenase CreE-like FAD/NAD(P)-binding domain-containing protein n=1 Tax=Algoriphagus iocasae TaxID=1836499 RepID=A0A841MK01_9BACT|nr:FAD/NAD(P)-binding protein [Algoriphagus iocasae]MBB6325797.1 hypothetical protein [Algoriphagus iocasae]